MRMEKAPSLPAARAKLCSAAGAGTLCPAYTPAVGAPTTFHAALLQRRRMPVGATEEAAGVGARGSTRSVALSASARVRGAALPWGSALL